MLRYVVRGWVDDAPRFDAPTRQLARSITFPLLDLVWPTGSREILLKPNR